MKMIEIIKKAGVGAVEAGSPVAVVYGTVQRTNPLEVRVDQRTLLPKDFLIIPEHLTEYKLNLDGREWLVRRGIEQGDKLILLRMQGGQSFIALGRVVSQ
ncbi:DUF2577 domain-containing protein [Paenibacillus senegalensis]|uniref:DUF2577 domain-containing protein n=1 Tax=Paenibacillus senegalensis TaxID=1465766 RepID=UPI00028A2E9F|nr:DUF2577 family protein [Paenibacillus senegalensis]